MEGYYTGIIGQSVSNKGTTRHYHQLRDWVSEKTIVSDTKGCNMVLPWWNPGNCSLNPTPCNLWFQRTAASCQQGLGIDALFWRQPDPQRMPTPPLSVSAPKPQTLTPTPPTLHPESEVEAGKLLRTERQLESRE